MKNLLDHYVGKPVIVRCIAYHYLGMLVEYDASHLVLVQCSWLAYSGERWKEFLDNGPTANSEIEPYPEDERVLVPRGTMQDLSTWRHALPREAL